MVTLTCVNHPTGVWLTKNPYSRNLHWCGWGRRPDQPNTEPNKFNKDLVPEDLSVWTECSCPFHDLRWVDEEGNLNPISTATWEVDF